ncbi:MAG: DUF2461 family protein [Alistipes indistinctus]
MINPSTLEFLSELRENNYREWFHSQKPRYEAAKTNVLDTAGQMLDGIRQFDPSLGFPTCANASTALHGTRVFQ